jgi:hypothetical protein
MDGDPSFNFGTGIRVGHRETYVHILIGPLDMAFQFSTSRISGFWHHGQVMRRLPPFVVRTSYATNIACVMSADNVTIHLPTTAVSVYRRAACIVKDHEKGWESMWLNISSPGRYKPMVYQGWSWKLSELHHALPDRKCKVDLLRH